MSGSGKLPPGPVAFPIIGNTLQLNMKNFAQHVEKLSAKYGPIFTIYLGSERVVVLYGHEIVKEALIGLGNEFSGRGSIPIFEKCAKGRGIIFSNGEQWKQLRQFALTTLRNFGMGKKSIEERIQEETHFLVERLRNTQGRPFDPTLFLTHTISNVICSIVFGDRFDYEDKKFVTLISLVQENDKLQRSPWTAVCSGVYSRWVTCCVEEYISEHLNISYSFTVKNQRCHQIFFQEQKNVQSEFNVESLARSTIELFVAGTGTTSITLKYGLLILLKYPEIEGRSLPSPHTQNVRSWGGRGVRNAWTSKWIQTSPLQSLERTMPGLAWQ
ncbi:prelamin-A/C [Platysternon megacephalum]|uniref:unspecific monooxygenase n=1 Tax=Platysternon megacephalum TaxID=55544 RepID=A0A4D9DF37_9SAUR|nr:prelamin-A/C [Platysternon megacephalum]